MAIRLRQTHDDPNAAYDTCSEHGCHEMFRLEIGGVQIPMCQVCVNQLARQCVPVMTGENGICEDCPPTRTDGKPSLFEIRQKEQAK